MRKRIPLILMALGLVVLLAGFGYDMVFAGIPYQDPTPELSARYEFHSRVASRLYLIGLGSMAVAVGWAVVRRLFRAKEGQAAARIAVL